MSGKKTAIITGASNTNLQEGWLAGDVVADSQGDGWGRAGRGYARCVGEKMRRAKGFAD
jgi:hypothetical protein